MNKKQMVIMWLGIVVIVALCLFPPYARIRPSSLYIYQGHYFVFSTEHLGRIDYYRLGLEVVPTVLLFVGLFVTFPKVNISRLLTRINIFRPLKRLICIFPFRFILRLTLYLLGPPMAYWGFWCVYYKDWIHPVEVSVKDAMPIAAAYLLLGYILIIVKKTIPRWQSVCFGISLLLGIGIGTGLHFIKNHHQVSPSAPTQPDILDDLVTQGQKPDILDDLVAPETKRVTLADYAEEIKAEKKTIRLKLP